MPMYDGRRPERWVANCGQTAARLVATGMMVNIVSLYRNLQTAASPTQTTYRLATIQNVNLNPDPNVHARSARRLQA